MLSHNQLSSIDMRIEALHFVSLDNLKITKDFLTVGRASFKLHN